MSRDAVSQPAGALRTWTRLDHVGTTSAILCALHCAGLPLLATVTPLVSLGLAQTEGLEWTFVIIGLLLGLSSLVPSFRRVHGRPLPLALFVAGIVVLLAARLVLEGDARVETPAAVAGALVMATAHVVNRGYSVRRATMGSIFVARRAGR